MKHNHKGGENFLIQFNHISKKYNDDAVVDDISFTVDKGELFVLIGPSGSGKTTTLKMINQLIPISEGAIHVNDKDIHDYDMQDLRFNIGYVLQQIALFPNMTVEENITIVPEMKKWSKEKMTDRVTELLDLVRLDPDKYRAREISELSGGEQQRIGVARALAADPDILLMDEPFSALDPISRKSLQDDLIDLQKQLKKTIVFVTHDMQEAVRLGDRIALMYQGHIEQIGTVDDILNHPKNDFVEEFLFTGLPFYDGQNTIKALIDNNFYTSSSLLSEEKEAFSVSDTVDDLTTYLSDNEQALVYLDDNQSASISREQLLTFLSNKNSERIGV